MFLHAITFSSWSLKVDLAHRTTSAYHVLPDESLLQNSLFPFIRFLISSGLGSDADGNIVDHLRLLIAVKDLLLINLVLSATKVILVQHCSFQLQTLQGK